MDKCDNCKHRPKMSYSSAPCNSCFHGSCFEKKEGLKQHSYQIEIPEGYQYCPECELLTPHTYNGYVDKVRYPEDWECDICGHKKDDHGYCCPMCGWEHDPDNDIAPETIKIKNHTNECIINRNLKWLNSISHSGNDGLFTDDDCDCPEVDAYPIQHIYNYRSSAQHWNMECSNAIEWSYDIMCKVCCYVFEVEDGNC